MRRELQTEQMRRRILDSALEVFGAEGYDGASMNAICTRAGISKGIIYHYFAGKEDLYLSCCRESTQKMADYLREHPVSGGTLRQQVREFWQCRDGPVWTMHSWMVTVMRMRGVQDVRREPLYVA